MPSGKQRREWSYAHPGAASLLFAVQWTAVFFLCLVAVSRWNWTRPLPFVPFLAVLSFCVMYLMLRRRWFYR